MSPSGGEITDVDQLRREVDPDEPTALHALLRHHMPAGAGPLIATAVCMYTNTPDEHFVLDFHPEYGFSDRDQRHRFNAFGVFQLPYELGLTTIFQARSAQPDQLLLPNDANLDSVVNDRPFVGGRDIGRNTIRKRNQFYTFDFRITRAFKIGEDAQIEPIIEVFNVFNNTNLVSVPRPLLFNFDGTVRSGFGDPRQAQLGLKVRF